MENIKYEIKENIGVISKLSKGWTKELNLISWNYKEPKYDLRDWSLEHEKTGNAITLTVDELRELKHILKNIEL